jgi:peptide-methionine (S)-S-oxide reductase
MFSRSFKSKLPTAAQALSGRATPMRVPDAHYVTGKPLAPTDPRLGQAMFGMGCFWGAERMFWLLPGVVSTAVGYAGGLTPNPTYEEVCSGQTGHTEVVRVWYDRARIEYEELLRTFWEGHDPTQGMRQGNDVGTQYRSAVYVFTDQQRVAAEHSRDAYARQLLAAGHGPITTEIAAAPPFYYAEDYHQQYLAQNPGVACPIGTGVEAHEGNGGPSVR